MTGERVVEHPLRQLGDWRLPPIGFGAMLLGMRGRPNRVEAIRTVHAALDGGARLVDTAINYCLDADDLGYLEALVGDALRSWSGDASEVLVVCKGGNTRTATEEFVQDARPESLRRSCELSLKGLGVERIDLYLLHAIDPKVPFAEQMGAIKELRDEGKIALVGVSNVGRRQLSDAQQIVEISAVENQLSPFERRGLPVLEVCTQQGIPWLAYSPLGGRTRAAAIGETLPPLLDIATARGVSPQQVALAWSVHQSPVVIPIPSARSPETVQDSLAATALLLSDEDLASIDAAADALAYS